MDSKTLNSTPLSHACITALLGATLALQGCNTVSSNAPKEQPHGHDHGSSQAEMEAHADRAFDELDGKKRATPPPRTQSAQAHPTRSAALPAEQAVKKHSQEPSWVMTPLRSSEWLYGVGSAGINSSETVASKIADDQAKVNLASNLRISVSGTNKSAETLKSGVVSQSFSSEVRNTVAAVSLTGLNITERYVDKKQSTVFSLAALHRQTALDIIGQQITAIDTQLLVVKNSIQSGTALERLRLALPALKQLEQRKQLNQQALDISEAKQNFPLPAELNALKVAIFATLDNLRFRIESKGNPIFRDGLVEALTGQGMRISQQGEADIVLDYRIDWRDVERSGKFYKFANANISLHDSSGKTLSSFRQKAKGVSNDAGLAKDKALTKLATQLGKKLAANLLNAID